MSYTLDSSSPACKQGANRALNKEVGQLHNGQPLTCTQVANDVLNKQVDELSTGNALHLHSG